MTITVKRGRIIACGDRLKVVDKDGDTVLFQITTNGQNIFTSGQIKRFEPPIVKLEISDKYITPVLQPDKPVQKEIATTVGFLVGTLVEWTSQASGVVRTKQGKILVRVPAWREPNAVLCESGCTGRLAGPGLPRNHDSYVVEQRETHKLYWPRVSQLKVI